MDAVEVFAAPAGGVAIHMVKRLVFGQRKLIRNLNRKPPAAGGAPAPAGG